MNEQNRVKINQLPTGVPGLDEILGGGLPEFSFNIIAGAPGCGKTTLAHQFIFANATVERPALYFTVMGEPALKMLRYQQQFTFFDPAKVGSSVHYVNLSNATLGQGLDAVAEMNELLLPFVLAAREREQREDDILALLWAEGSSIMPDWGLEDVQAWIATMIRSPTAPCPG